MPPLRNLDSRRDRRTGSRPIPSLPKNPIQQIYLKRCSLQPQMIHRKRRHVASLGAYAQEFGLRLLDSSNGRRCVLRPCILSNWECLDAA